MNKESATTAVLVPGRGRMIVASLLLKLEELRKMEWKFQQWRPTPALIERKGGAQVQYVGQKYDPTYFELVEDGWTHDHCEICYVILGANDEVGETNSYVSNGDWLCTICYKYLVEPSDLNEVFRSLATD